jgi:hypothetical protein
MPCLARSGELLPIPAYSTMTMIVLVLMLTVVIVMAMLVVAVLKAVECRWVPMRMTRMHNAQLAGMELQSPPL